MRLLSCLVVLGCVLLTGCGHVAYQSRYIPHVRDLSWDKEYQQLPWREPALQSNEHYSYRANPPHPKAQHQTRYSMGHGVLGFYFPGDMTEADRAARRAKAE